MTHYQVITHVVCGLSHCLFITPVDEELYPMGDEYTS